MQGLSRPANDAECQDLWAEGMIFYPGLHQPSDAKHFNRACICINRLRGPKGRKAPLPAQLAEVLIDSGAFMELFTYGRYRHGPEEYARDVVRWCDGRIIAVVAQDYMCEPFILAKTGLTIADHQRLTIERFDALAAALVEVVPAPLRPPIMPVLQGWAADDYVQHLRAYGDRLRPGMRVGVGSVCKRQSRPETLLAILRAIHAERPGLLLHGFGVKLTALAYPGVAELLDTSDSMAWSYSARKQGRSANDYREALAFSARVEGLAA